MSSLAERIITALVGAGIIGLFILNAPGTASVLDSLGKNSVNLVTAVQGR